MTPTVVPALVPNVGGDAMHAAPHVRKEHEMQEWETAALAAGFDVDALGAVADLVACGVIAVDGPPLEEVPGIWVLPGFLPYDGRTVLAVADTRDSGARRSSN
jgi:hypothetical protein